MSWFICFAPLGRFLIRNIEVNPCQTEHPCNYFTGDDWHFFGFGFIWSLNITFNQSVSPQHVLAVTSVFPRRVSNYVKTGIKYICHCISQLPSFSPSFTCFLIPFFALSSLFFSSFFSPPFLGVPVSEPSIFPQSVELKTEPLFPAARKQGGREEAGWLPGCQLWVCVSVRKSSRDRCDDDRATVDPGDWFQPEKSRLCYTTQTVASK